jgi:hypothetical protein
MFELFKGSVKMAHAFEAAIESDILNGSVGGHQELTGPLYPCQIHESNKCMAYRFFEPPAERLVNHMGHIRHVVHGQFFVEIF